LALDDNESVIESGRFVDDQLVNTFGRKFYKNQNYKLGFFNEHG